ncbi:allantoin permease [Novosphingobium fuchskuhlense]|uniref:Allantoin permease n=1 Tax=Novosphingobium fuchskuhlense TaxID=1117702 RepID=A0A117UXI2_9SPHN|nr:cytosine permease [Novosphingobium fuchskuhlense]KUR72658.1 allantoin permease [Novosphingobium fuchskuhlense]
MSSASLIEKRSIDYVPLSERHGKVWHLWPIWFAGDANLGTLAIGAIGPMAHLPLIWSLAAIVTGCAFGTFFMAFHSTQGPQMGLPQMIQSRPQFGYMGALLVWIVAIITYFGYNIVCHIIAGQAVHQVTGLAQTTAYVPFGGIAIALAVVGYKWIHVAQRWLSYVMIAALVIFSLGALSHWDQLVALAPAASRTGSLAIKPFMAQFFAAAAYQLSWSIYVSDYSRYLPPKVGVRASFWWTFLGAGIGGAWTMALGAVAVVVSGNADVVAGIVQTGDAIVPHLGVAVLLGALLGLLTISSLNFYGASLTLLSIMDSLSITHAIIRNRLFALSVMFIPTLIIAYLARGAFVVLYSSFLSIIIYLFTPWTAINLIDFYFLRKGHYSINEIFNRDGMYGQWNKSGISAYFIGFMAMVPFFSTDAYIGPIAKMLGGIDVSMLIGLPVSALLYLWFNANYDPARELRQIALADANLPA